MIVETIDLEQTNLSVGDDGILEYDLQINATILIPQPVNNITLNCKIVDIKFP